MSANTCLRYNELNAVVIMLNLMNSIINNYLQIRTYFLVGDYDITVNIEKEHY